MRLRVSDIATANPETSFSQDEMLELLGLEGDRFAETIFSRGGIDKRHLDVSADKLSATLQARATGTEELLLQLAIEAVEALDVDPNEVGTLITAAYYSLGGPTIAHRLLGHYEMDPATDKYHVAGVGCASAVPLFKLAGQAMRDHPGKPALVVAIDSMSGVMSRVNGSDARPKVVSLSLFADGCGAAVLRDDGDAGPEVLATRVYQVPGTLDAVHFQHAHEDSFFRIGRELPAVAKTLGPLVDEFLAQHGRAAADVAHWMVHPGGRAILDSVQEAVGLSDEQIAVSRDVLSRYGNMGTPTSFYVLQETIAQREPRPGDVGLMITIGPGVTAGFMLLEW
ncbi:MAG TPA: 3-oxoacyl-[acyl-carrier-protein] synthase III C-terminal domain-containing protein [Conexibacter sp.]|nr:3-oxoacyl-[acyl-carrier-protein] synthase III C-terminal domain-containing protein [Conexibacter sp.]